MNSSGVKVTIFYYELPINFAQAALGTEFVIPALEDEIKIKIPPVVRTALLSDSGIKVLPISRIGAAAIKLSLFP